MLCFRAAEIPAALIFTTSIVNGDCLSKLAEDCLRDSIVPVHLEELGMEDAQKLVGFFTCNPERATQILQWAGGHPLLIEQYAQMPDISSKLPRKIDSFVTRSLANLNKDTLLMAQIISLFEKPIGIDVIAEVSGRSNADVQSCLQTLSSRAIAVQRQSAVFIKYECVRSKLLSERFTETYGQAECAGLQGTQE